MGCWIDGMVGCKYKTHYYIDAHVNTTKVYSRSPKPQKYLWFSCIYLRNGILSLWDIQLSF